MNKNNGVRWIIGLSIWLIGVKLSPAQTDSLWNQSRWGLDSTATATILPKKDSLPPSPPAPPKKSSAKWQLSDVVVKGIDTEKKQKAIAKRLKPIEDTLSLQAVLTEIALQEASRGYKAFSVEDIKRKKDTLIVQFYQGEIFAHEKWEIKGLPQAESRRFRLDFPLPKPKVLREDFLTANMKEALIAYQNQGYPFAKFVHDSTGYRKSSDTVLVYDRYKFEPGTLFKIDSVVITGRHREKNAFIYNMMNVAPGDIYNQAAIEDISRILNNSAYFKNVKTPTIEYNYLGQTKLRIALEQRKANKFDVLVGILQPTTNNPQNTDRRVQFVGSLDVVLVSTFRLGESLQLKFDKLQQTSQRLNIKANVPYILHLPVQIGGEFDLFKNSEDFQNVAGKVNGEYGFSPFLSTRLTYKIKATTLSDTLTKLIAVGTRNPGVLDGRQSLYGVGFRYEKLDNKISPTRGFYGLLELGGGTKTIRKNAGLPNALYDTLTLIQPAIEGELTIRGFLPFGKRNVIMLANRSYALLQQQMFQNDQMPLGGGKTLRGFNENQFFSDRFSLFTAEYRFLLERNSYLMGFCDAAWMQNRVLRTTQMPIGLGLGLTYETPAGIVSFIYAVGQEGDVKFQPTRGRIHIGLISQF